MADNLDWTPGSGATIATDQDSSAPNAHYQLVKCVWGPLDTFNLVDTASGKPLPVQLRTSGGVEITLAEDLAHTSGDPGFMSLAVRKATPANLSGADGDYEPLQVANGKLWITGVYPEDTASADGDPIQVIGAKRADTPAATSGTDGDYEPLQVSGGLLWTTALSKPFTVSVDVTRPADTTAYAVDDAIANATASAVVQTYSNVARVSGGSCLITDVMVISSNNAPATMLQGELWLLDTSPTANNDNAAFTLTDAEAKTVVAVIPFTLAKASANNCVFHATRLNILCTTVGSANLIGQLKAKNAYTPANAEVITCRLKGFWLN